MLEATVERAMRIADADRYTVQLLDPATGALRIVAQRGFNRTFLDFFETVDDTDPAYGTALRARQPVWVPDVTQSSSFADTPALNVMWDAGVRAIAVLPVSSPDGKVFAMLAVHRARPTAWGADCRAQLKRLVRATTRDCLDAIHAISLT
jgi:GAF domain-containing protein